MPRFWSVYHQMGARRYQHLKKLEFLALSDCDRVGPWSNLRKRGYALETDGRESGPLCQRHDPARTNHLLSSSRGVFMECREGSNDGNVFRTMIPGRDRAKKRCEMGIAVSDRERTSGISKQTPFKGTKEVERNVPMAFGHGMSVLWPDRRQGVFTRDWGRLCRWEVRASARGEKRRGRNEGENGGGYLGTLSTFYRCSWAWTPASINSFGSKMMGGGKLRFPCLFLFVVALVCHPSLCLPLCPAGASAVAREPPDAA